MDDDRRDLDDRHRHLRPVHAIVEDGKTTIARRPGRPARARVPPAHDQRAYERQLAELQARWVERDAIVRATGGEGRSELLDHVLAGIAEEIGSLRWERSRLSPAHPNAAIITSRIIAALLKAAEVVLVRAKLGSGQLDVRSCQFQAVFRHFMAMMKEAAVETMGEDAAGTFLHEVHLRMTGWEDRADEILGQRRG